MTTEQEVADRAGRDGAGDGEGVGYDPRYWAHSVRDLLQARDAYHVHLLDLENVVGTAIGRYLVRDDDPDGSLTPEARLQRTPGSDQKEDRSMGAAGSERFASRSAGATPTVLATAVPSCSDVRACHGVTCRYR